MNWAQASKSPHPEALPEYRARGKRGTVVLVILTISLILRQAARADIDEAQFRADLAALCAPSSRAVGSDGYYAAVKYVQHEVESLPNVELRRHEYAVTVPFAESVKSASAVAATSRIPAALTVLV